jgi:glycosyltransferase involved in cell wall biosynthesis
VDPTAYTRKADYAVGPVPRLLWLGSPATEPYLDLVAAALLRVHRLTGARLTLISAGARPLGNLAAMTDRVGWDASLTNATLAGADCGIMPLTDTPFTRGKCAYKLLQYGAAGLPVAASPVGANRAVLERLHGMAAVDTASWVDALVDLLRAPEAERRARGDAARRAVEEHYSYRAWREPFLRALRLPTQPTGAPASSGSPSQAPR